MTGSDERIIMVFLRDRERDLGTAYKTRGHWRDGAFDAGPWLTGDLACDCARGRLFYSRDGFACGTERFGIERIVAWDTGETVDAGGEEARRAPPGHERPVPE